MIQSMSHYLKLLVAVSRQSEPSKDRDFTKSAECWLLQCIGKKAIHMPSYSPFFWCSL